MIGCGCGSGWLSCRRRRLLLLLGCWRWQVKGRRPAGFLAISRFGSPFGGSLGDAKELWRRIHGQVYCIVLYGIVVYCIVLFKCM